MDASFIIPALNEEKYIEACLEAIKSQRTRLSFEIIVVDNGSTDRTAELAKSLGADVVECRRRGIAVARNAGADASKGKLLVFVDADTRLSADYLQKSHLYLQEHPDAVALTGKLILSGENEYLKLIDKLDNSFFEFMAKIKAGRLSGSNAVIRRGVFFEVGGFPEVPSEDVAISKLLRGKGRLAYLPDIEAVTSSRRLDQEKIKTLVYYLLRDIATSLEMKGASSSSFRSFRRFRRKLYEKFRGQLDYRQIR